MAAMADPGFQRAMAAMLPEQCGSWYEDSAEASPDPDAYTAQLEQALEQLGASARTAGEEESLEGDDCEGDLASFAAQLGLENLSEEQRAALAR
eukprot:CAMPEP_0168695430 /NCGR_PEP_ID=MMETSP0503-20121227/34815_1 /TAXON_ID=89963 /ORGANISM="Heterocapsa rotundata, Strain SCCAP K-0483" /LENGTH=93 /DNA_ID=CAMNT_0008741125 /DNA_START=21 /DNA_END=298 /DNA_ORIENTATION=-